MTGMKVPYRNFPTNPSLTNAKCSTRALVARATLP